MPTNAETQLNLFDKFYKKKLADDEIQEMRHNLYGFMELLIEIDREQKE